METQGLVVEIGDLADRPGAIKQIRRTEAIARMGGPLAWVEKDEPVEVLLEATSVIEGIAVSGSASGTLHLNCSRCLADFSRDFEQRIDETFYFDEQRAVELDGYGIHEMTIDLEPMLRDVIVLGMPVNPLHDPDCRGLCSACGQDLNVADCGHSRVARDLRWAPLEAMFSGNQGL